MDGTARRDDEPLRWLRVSAGIAAAALLVMVAVTGALLTWRYRPDGGSDVSLLPASARWSRRLVRRHQLALGFAIPAVAIWAGLTIADSWTRSRPHRRAVVAAGAAGALVLTLLTSFAWRLVKFQQIALWAVTVGTDIRGLWFAGFARGVRFVLVGGVEVSQRTIAVWVIVHLFAPGLALAAMVAVWQGRRVGRVRAHG